MLHRLRKRPKTVKFRRLFDVCKCRSNLCRRPFAPRFQPLAGVYSWGCHAAGRVSYFYRSNGRSNPHKHYLIALPFRQSCSYDPRFRRPLKRTFRRTGILLLSKRKRYVRRTFRRTKTRKNLRSNRHLATEKPAKTQENSGICTPLMTWYFRL